MFSYPVPASLPSELRLHSMHLDDLQGALLRRRTRGAETPTRYVPSDPRASPGRQRERGRQSRTYTLSTRVILPSSKCVARVHIDSSPSAFLFLDCIYESRLLARQCDLTPMGSPANERALLYLTSCLYRQLGTTRTTARGNPP